MARLRLGDGTGITDVATQLMWQIQSLDPERLGDPVEALKWQARRDYKTFMELMYPTYVDGAHLTLLREALEAVERGEVKRLIVTMPPRHSKSLHVSESFPAWYLGNHPDHRVIAASHTQMLAEKMSLRVRQKFLDPNWPFDARLSEDHGGVSGWDIENSPTGGYVPIGRGGSPAGLGADLIIIDDPIGNQQDADSALIRDRLWDWYQGSIFTRRQPGAAIIITATRWHEDDLTGRLLEAERNGGERWEELHLPAQFADGSYLWPEFWSEAEYEKAKMGADRVWLAQYMGRPSRQGGNLFKEDWFGPVLAGETYVGIVQAWDCAEKPGVTNDYSVCATIGVGISSYDVLHVWRGRPEFPDLLQTAQDQAAWAQALYPGIPFKLAIEDASAGTQLLQMLRPVTRYPIIDVKPQGKDPKMARVLRNTPLARSRRIRIQQQVSWRGDFLREFKGFPNEAHDDVVDAVLIGVDVASGVSGSSARAENYLEGKPVDARDAMGRRRYRPPATLP